MDLFIMLNLEIILYVKSLSDSLLFPSGKIVFGDINIIHRSQGEIQMSWIHHTQVKKMTKPLRTVEEKEPLKLKLKKATCIY